MLKRITAALVAAVLSLVLSATAWAADSALTVQLKDKDDAPIAGLEVELLRLATGEGRSAVLEESFAAAGLSVEQLVADGGAAQAETLCRFALREGLHGETAVSSAEGEAVFSAPERGLYLVFAREGQSFYFLPYLVWLTGSAAVSMPKVEESGSRSLTVSKVWDDGNDADGLRPDMVAVTLFRDGVALRRVYLSGANGWRHTFSALPDSGAYEVKEAAVSGYTARYAPTAEGIQITNVHRSSAPEAATVTVSKVWDDADNAAGLRPESVTVQLVEKDTVLRTAVLSESNDWRTTFYGLKERASYSVWELPVTGYTASYSGNAADGFVISNRYAEEPVPPSPDEPTPDEPQPTVPTIPQTGAQMYLVYALLAAGVLLTLLGGTILRWGRREE